MKNLILPFFIWCMSANVFAQINPPPIENWAKASVIIVDNIEQVVYARKIDGANMFTFSVKKEDVKKFLPEDEINVQFNNQRVHVNASKSQAQDWIRVTNLHMPAIWSHDFYVQLLIIETRNAPFAKTQNNPARKMRIVRYRESNLVKACCDEGTANGIEFTIPQGMVESDLKPEVRIYNHLVLTDKQTSVPPLMVCRITSYYVDTTKQNDTSNVAKAPKQFEQDEKKYARPNTGETDKWVITPVTTMKGVLGKLDINFPADVDRDILVYQPADKKFITSVSRNDKTYSIAPGEYRFTITNVPVENVPIQKGYETRLKMGFLNVVSEGDWHLYNDTKEIKYTSGNKPKKIALPVGNYQVKLGGQFYPFTIKDKETVEY